MKIVIVGGVAGGATAAARLRRLNEQAEIVVFERSGYISYANCGLPYYIGGVISAPEALTLQTPESFFARPFPIDVQIARAAFFFTSEVPHARFVKDDLSARLNTFVYPSDKTESGRSFDDPFPIKGACGIPVCVECGIVGEKHHIRLFVGKPLSEREEFFRVIRRDEIIRVQP